MENNPIQLIAAALLSAAIALIAYKKKALKTSGALTGFLVMAIHLASNYRYGALLLVFFLRPYLIRMCRAACGRRALVDGNCRSAGPWDSRQVLSKCIIATTLAVNIWYLTGEQNSCFDSKQATLVKAHMGGIIGHYSCWHGGTWLSELAALTGELPVKVTTMKEVGHGTYAAITKASLLAAVWHGFLNGAAYAVSGLLGAIFGDNCVYTEGIYPIMFLSSLLGLCGSLMHSWLGKAVRCTGDCGYCNFDREYDHGAETLDEIRFDYICLSLTTLLGSLLFLIIV